jgi:hypothetical protein
MILFLEKTWPLVDVCSRGNFALVSRLVSKLRLAYRRPGEMRPGRIECDVG